MAGTHGRYAEVPDRFEGRDGTFEFNPGSERLPVSREPGPDGFYVGECDAYMPTMWYPGDGWDWTMKCLPLPCSLCGLKTTHRHATIT